jgi:hypothetical protein
VSSAQDNQRETNPQVPSDVALPQIEKQIDHKYESISDEEKISHIAHSLAENLIFYTSVSLKPPKK